MCITGVKIIMKFEMATKTYIVKKMSGSFKQSKKEVEDYAMVNPKYVWT